MVALNKEKMMKTLTLKKGIKLQMVEDGRYNNDDEIINGFVVVHIEGDSNLQGKWDGYRLPAHIFEEFGMTLKKLNSLENAFSDIRLARDSLMSQGVDVGSYQLNSISDADYGLKSNQKELISEIRYARDFLMSEGYDVGSFQLNSISDAQLDLPEMEDCIDF